MKSFIDDIGNEKADQLMRNAVRKAVGEAEELGLPSLIVLNDVLFEKYSDGRLVEIKKLESHVEVPGTSKTHGKGCSKHPNGKIVRVKPRGTRASIAAFSCQKKSRKHRTKKITIIRTKPVPA